MEYWIIIDEAEHGPYTLGQLENIEFSGNTPVWHQGLADWVPAAQVDELGYILSRRAPAPAVVTAEVSVPAEAADGITPREAEPAPAQADVTVETPRPLCVPADAIPAGYVLVARDETKCPPTYLVWAIITTVVCFLPMGVCAILCANKVKKHFKAGNFDRACAMSERAALFVILSIVAWLVWMPFSIVFAMF